MAETIEPALEAATVMERYEIILPVSSVEADMAGMPAAWLERAVRAVGTLIDKSSDPYRASPQAEIDRLLEALRHLPDIAENFMLRFNVHDLPEDKAQQWQSLEHEIALARRALHPETPNGDRNG